MDAPIKCTFCDYEFPDYNQYSPAGFTKINGCGCKKVFSCTGCQTKFSEHALTCLQKYSVLTKDGSEHISWIILPKELRTKEMIVASVIEILQTEMEDKENPITLYKLDSGHAMYLDTEGIHFLKSVL